MTIVAIFAPQTKVYKILVTWSNFATCIFIQRNTFLTEPISNCSGICRCRLRRGGQCGSSLSTVLGSSPLRLEPGQKWSAIWCHSDPNLGQDLAKILLGCQPIVVAPEKSNLENLCISSHFRAKLPLYWPCWGHIVAVQSFRGVGYSSP